jgi:peptidoglycan/LPS O-acetylase OafA/YrhL
MNSKNVKLIIGIVLAVLAIVLALFVKTISYWIDLIIVVVGLILIILASVKKEAEGLPTIPSPVSPPVEVKKPEDSNKPESFV